MQAELDRFFWALGVSLALGVALFVFRILVARSLRKRLPPGLVPSGADLHAPDGMSRLTALLGHDATETVTLDTRRLRTTLGLRLMYWTLLVAIILTAISMNAALVGPETAIILVVTYMAVHAATYEIRYDRDSISLPRWWFGHSTHRWRDLEALTERQGWYLVFHFRGGKTVSAHKYVVGYSALREKAQSVLREV